jgi:hypothetical protein
MKFSTKKFVKPTDVGADTARAGFGIQICMKGVCTDTKAVKVNIHYPKQTAPAPAETSPALPAPNMGPVPASAPAAKKDSKGTQPSAKKDAKPTTASKQTLAPTVGRKK